MRVRFSLDFDPRELYVIARVADKDPETKKKMKGRTYAQRVEARSFAIGAIRRMIREHAEALRGQQRTVERRLAESGKARRTTEREVVAPDQRQKFLFD